MQQETIKSRLKKKGWYDTHLRFASFDREFVSSEALLALSATAIRVYLRMLIKRPSHKLVVGKKKGDYVLDNGPIIFTYAEAECFGIPRSSFSRAIKELVNKGFIKILHQGGTVGNGRDWNTYELIDDWKLYGNPDFTPRAKEKPISYSFGLKKYNEGVRLGLKKRGSKKAIPSAKNGISEVPKMALRTA